MFKALKELIKRMRKKSRVSYLSGAAMGSGEYHDTELPQQISFNQPTQWTTFDNATNAVTTGSVAVGTYKTEAKKDERIEVKPVEVVKEIVTETPSMMLDGLDKQIKIVKKRIRILMEQDIKPRDEEEALGYLKARTYYKKRQKLFPWSITTNEKINELCKKYKLRKVGFNAYYKTVPTEALDELEKYVSACKKVRSGAPDISLIIDDGGKETRRDPIMLASAPFGRWFYVIGAWDKEIEVVGELIYNAK